MGGCGVHGDVSMGGSGVHGDVSMGGCGVHVHGEMVFVLGEGVGGGSKREQQEEKL